MAITTVDGIISGLLPPVNFLKNMTAAEAAGQWMSTIQAPGNPGAGSIALLTMSGISLTTRAGQIPFTPNGAGSYYLARFSANSSVAGTLILADRLWENRGIVPTGSQNPQTVASVVWPDRSADGTNSGLGVNVAFEVFTATTNAAAVNVTAISYTNSDGTAGMIGSMGGTAGVAPAIFPATAVVGTFVPFSLAPGDKGVRSVQSVTLGSTYTAGSILMVAYREIARVPITSANIEGAVDVLTAGMPRMYSGTTPFLLWIPTATNAPQIQGQVIYTQG